MVAHRLGKADLGLPHAFGTALAAAVEEEDDGPLLVNVAAPFFGEIDLEAVSGAVQLEAAIEKAGLLRGLRPGGVGAGRGSGSGARRYGPSEREAGGKESKRPEHAGILLQLYLAGSGWALFAGGLPAHACGVFFRFS